MQLFANNGGFLIHWDILAFCGKSCKQFLIKSEKVWSFAKLKPS